MVKKDRKARVEQLTIELQKSIAPEAIAVKELLILLFEEAKNKLVSSEGDQTLRLQGEAKALERLYIQLTRPALNQEQ
jgi:hypothetical protein